MSVDNYDVIIIGAGSVGTPLAMFLAEKTRKVLVIDSLPSVGQGQNKCAIGGVRATHSDGSKIKAALRSIQIFSAWRKKRGDDIGWLQGGYFFPVYSEKDEVMLKDMLKTQQGFGLDINWIGPEKARKLVPGIAAGDLRGGTYSPGDGSASPLLSANAFYRRALKLGAKFNFNESVTGFIKENGAIKGVKTTKASYCAPLTVNAAGAYAAPLSELAGVIVPVRPDSHEAGITEPVERFFEPMVVDLRPGEKSLNYYFYQNSEGQLVFCLTPSPPSWGDDRRSTSEFLTEISKRMINLMPAAANIKVRRTWRGLYPMTPDGFPIADFPKNAPGYALAVGMCGQGFMLGPGLGATLASVIAGCGSKEDMETLEGFRLGRNFSGQEKLK
ncbi:MAG: FAD-binding oxidoreductase [Elusimicrobia bacterium]|nr:FAD-binding oxidoreductase [Elusimicrobiota bacterium]